VRTNGLLALALLALVGCSSPPTYLEAHGHFGDGTPIDFREDAILTVGTDPQTGALTARLQSQDNAAPPFAGMIIQVNLDAVTTAGSYTAHHDGSGDVQLQLLVPAEGYMNTSGYMADGNLDLIELPINGTNRLAGSFSSVVVNYDGQDMTIEQGHFRGQL
jgi:hypothetical protein